MLKMIRSKLKLWNKKKLKKKRVNKLRLKENLRKDKNLNNYLTIS